MNIALWGTFDWESLGDTMFPQILKKVLKKRIKVERFFLFSLTSIDNSYNNNGHVYSLDEFEAVHERYGIDWIILSGGELFHNRPIEYKLYDGKMYYTKPGVFWKKAAEYSKNFKIPVIVNLVGVPYEFGNEEKEELLECVKFFSWIAVRDRFSKDKLINAGIKPGKIKTVYDGLLLFNEYYSAEFLESVRKKIIEKNYLSIKENYVVLQYDTTKNLDVLCEIMQKISKIYDVQVLLLPVNRCHNDVEVAGMLYERSEKQFINVDIYLQPVEIMSFIAGAKVFIGTSFHGSVVAISYGVKSIALDMYSGFVSKMDGLYESFNIYNYLLRDIRYLEGAFQKIWNDTQITENNAKKLQNKQQVLNKYYDSLSKFMIEKNIVIQESDEKLTNERKVWKKSTLEVYRKDGILSYYNGISNVQGDDIEFEFKVIENNIEKCRWYSYIDRPVAIRNLKIKSSYENIVGTAEDAEWISENQCRFGGLSIGYNFIIGECCNDKINISYQVRELSQTEAFMAVQHVLNNKEAHLEQLIKSERELQAELGNKRAHIELLLESERTLSREILGRDEKIKELSDELNKSHRCISESKIQIESMRNQIKSAEKHISDLEAAQKSILESKRWKLLCVISKFIPKRKR